MKIKKVVVSRDGKMVHASVPRCYRPYRPGNPPWKFATICGGVPTNDNYSEHDYDARFVINCKRCRNIMNKDKSTANEWPYIRLIWNGNRGGVIHAVHFGSSHTKTTKCGSELNFNPPYKAPDGYSTWDGTEDEVTCKRCRSVMIKEHSKERATVNKDIYYEVKFKDGNCETITDCESAEEAAVAVEVQFGIDRGEIECINRIRVEEVIFPSISISFEE